MNQGLYGAAAAVVVVGKHHGGGAAVPRRTQDHEIRSASCVRSKSDIQAFCVIFG